MQDIYLDLNMYMLVKSGLIFFNTEQALPHYIALRHLPALFTGSMYDKMRRTLGSSREGEGRGGGGIDYHWSVVTTTQELQLLNFVAANEMCFCSCK